MIVSQIWLYIIPSILQYMWLYGVIHELKKIYKKYTYID